MSVNILSKKRLSIVVGLLSAGIGFPGAVQAQPQLEEVLVTAQKREESAQDIPVAVSAIDSESLENMGVNDFNDLTKVSPSLTITQGDQANNSPIALRGIGTFAFGMSIEPSVAVIIDDVPVAASAQAFSNLVDVERIEVLRGPQSTLFGKSASAGVINITTKGPSEYPEATIELSATDDEEVRVLGSASGMLTDTLGVRVSGYHSDYEGHVENLHTGNTINGKESKGLRSKFRWDASADLTLTLIADINESEDNCCASPFNYASPEARNINGDPPAVWLEGITPSRENDQVRIDAEPRNTSDDWSTTLKAEYDMGEHTLASITGLRKWEYTFFQDIDATQTFELNQSSGYETDLLTQEFRLTSPAYDKFDYVAGLYFEKKDNSRWFQRGPVFVADWSAEADNEIAAVFAQGKYSINNSLTMIGGLRYHEEDIGVSFLRPGDDPLTGTSSDDVVLGKLSLQYFTAGDLMFFASYSQGHKGEGYDITSSFSESSAESPVGAETSDSFELGMKGTFLNRRLQLNTTLFSTSYEGFQAQSTVTNAETQTLEFKLNNVGDLQTSGVEVDAVALLTENLQVDMGLALIDAEIDEFTGADCYGLQTEAQGCVDGKQDLSGTKLNNSPDLKVTLGANYDWRFDDMPFDGFINGSYQWQDEVRFSLLNDPTTYQDAYGIFNLNVGIRDKDDAYKLTLFVNNVTDESYVSGAGQSQGLFGGESVLTHQVPRAAQRYAGVKLKLNF
ncbi:TonB-dependent receptor [Marinimicrobium sp. C6131]|uniref:TonB-dependent receptor n=1 Tax=Marinimicrobium sp. C6131 TaxID=3022676 RepID=UPI00223DEE56|nr:TonB-dependent receptor [Marinimicrobium sp. C6131]UZJ44113.1 TonB-dependent receptor [Marinimicrobium sp. C6131]